jgi:DNA-binding transcriptional LysR family regulator
MHLDFKDLNLFIQIAEAPSLTQGAKKAFISPGAASVRIKALEAQLNVYLLYRDSRGVELTDAGKRLLKHARLIMRQMAYLKTEFTEYDADTSGHIKIFANTTAVRDFLPEVLAGYLAKHPGVSVDLQERLSRDIVRGVLDGSTDLGIIAGPVAAKELQVLHCSTDRLVLVVPKGHELDTEKNQKFISALAFHHVGLQDGSPLQEFVREQAEKLGGKLSLRIQVPGFESICKMVEAGVGIGVISEPAAIRHSKTMNFSIVQLDEAWAVRERSILVRGFDALPACARGLISLLKPNAAEYLSLSE